MYVKNMEANTLFSLPKSDLDMKPRRKRIVGSVVQEIYRRMRPVEEIWDDVERSMASSDWHPSTKRERLYRFWREAGRLDRIERPWKWFPELFRRGAALDQERRSLGL